MNYKRYAEKLCNDPVAAKRGSRVMSAGICRGIRSNVNDSLKGDVIKKLEGGKYVQST